MHTRRLEHAIIAVIILTTSTALAGPPAVVEVPADEPTIQDGIDAVAEGGEVIVALGVYNEVIDFGGKAITVRSTNPTDPVNVLATVIDGTGLSGHVVSCVSGEGADTMLVGLTVTGTGVSSMGGMINDGSSPTVVGCMFLDNGTGGSGGGMRNVSSSPLVFFCIFKGNTALEGGGMYNVDSDPDVRYCIFEDNHAQRIFDLFAAGGGMCNISSDPAVLNCAFVGNVAEGGGFGGGGAMYNRDSSPVLINCLIADNAGELPFGDSGGMFSRDASNPVVTNTILWNNTPENVIDLFGASTTITYSDVEDGWPGAGNIDADPVFVDPDGLDDDPSTYEDNDYHLAAGSPCIDAGDTTAVPVVLPIDLSSNPRIVDDPATVDTGIGGPPVVDMGVYEFQPLDLCAADFDRSGTIDVVDLLTLLAAWGGDGARGGDVDGDGTVGVVDLLALLGTWGPCPPI